MQKIPILILLLLLFLHCPLSYSQETITIATGDWPPMLDEKAKHYGYANHMLKLAFASQGVDCKFIFLPWKRAYELTKSGKYNCTTYWYCTEKRREDFYCGQELIAEPYLLFHLKTIPPFSWHTFKDLKPYKFGLTLGYTYADELVEMIDTGELKGEWVSTDKQNFKKLLMGRIDMFPIPEAVGLFILNRDFRPEQRDRITYHHSPIINTTNHPLFPRSRKDSQKYLALYNKGFTILKRDGTLDKYYEKMIMGWYAKTE